jgi:hypothetical protein
MISVSIVATPNNRRLENDTLLVEARCPGTINNQTIDGQQ